MITAEELAKEIRVHPNWWYSPEKLAGHLIPFIQSRAAGEQGVAYDRELIATMLHEGASVHKFTADAIREQIRLLRDADNADAAGVRTVSRPPKDAGAVSIPDVIAYRQTVKFQSEPWRIDTFVFPVDVHPKPEGSEDVCTLADAIRYGNAREAAGRADVVPTDSAQKARNRVHLWFFRDMTNDQRIKLLKLFGLPADEMSTHGTQIHGLRYIFDALSAHPSPAHAGAGDAEALAKIAIDHAAKKLYGQHTDNHPTMHCNRFPAWSELKDADREEWREKARRLAGGDHE